MSLRARVLVGAAVIAVVLAVGAFITIRTTEDNLIDQVDAQLLAAADNGREHGFGRGPGGPRPGRPPDAEPQRLSELYVGLVVDRGVSTVFRSNLTGIDVPEPAIAVDDAVRAASTDEAFTAGAEDADLRYRVRAVQLPRDGQVVVLALPLSGVDDAVDRLLAVALVVTAAVLAVVAAVAWWVVHLGVRPIKQMTATASAIAGGELSHRVPDVAPGTEAGELGTALNQMLGRIEEAFDERRRSEERLRRFIADASHELRTPITTIRGYAELYRAGGLDDGDELREAMRRTEQESARMGGVIDDLLQLARLDQGRPLAREPVDLAAVVDDAARDARAVAPDRAIACATEAPLVVTGDPDRLRQVVANVVGNALVHTAPEVALTLRATREGDTARIEVADEGDGMPPGAVERAFERFYRADPSRSRHHGGSGLGLAIVEAVVRAHGGAVTLDSELGRGTTVRIDIPLAPADPA